uniref:Fic family toxin-antitoxin system n=1 Tax=uncultured bacterium FPPS_57A9 TaxID=1343847 RepID=S4WB43_9BACT|nr:fic family toxin-antitoxin system [uncultured bacterium FPPS_57A9]
MIKNQNKQTYNMVSLDDNEFQKLIYTIRGEQVMLDRDLAILYGVQTGRLNEQVKRNIKRFPERLMFQLTKEELNDWMSQIAISNKEKMGIRKMPFAFNEQGVAMLSAVLRSDIAINISLKIMDAFVEMRKFIGSNAQLFQRIDKIELKQLTDKTEIDTKFNQVFDAIEAKDITPKQGIIYNGQIFDAHVFVSKIIRSAKKSIVLIDNYIDESVLTLLTKRKKGVSAKIITKSISKRLELDVQKFNEQYEPIQINVLKTIHDRFIIIDEKDLYNSGASLKDLGKKISTFTKMEKSTLEMLGKLK